MFITEAVLLAQTETELAESIQMRLSTLTEDEKQSVVDFIDTIVSHRYRTKAQILLERMSLYIKERDLICKDLKISFAGLSTKNQKREFSDLRGAFYVILKVRFGFSQTEISDIIQRDHTTVISGLKKFFSLLESKDRQTLQTWENVKKWASASWKFDKNENELIDQDVNNIKPICLKKR